MSEERQTAGIVPVTILRISGAATRTIFDDWNEI